MSPSKYILTPPEGLHPLIDKRQDNGHEVFPDFDPWSHTAEDDKIMANFVAKGYYTTSKVSFESISARSSLQEALPKIADQLAEDFTKIVQVREGDINRISAKGPDTDDLRLPALSGPTFALPNRVTLTDHRKELWLQELCSPYASVQKVLKYIPHGLKRRQVLEQCFLKQIPLRIAVWLIKCCFSTEWKSAILKTKHQNSPSISVESVTAELYKEWTESFVHILGKLVFSMTQYYNDPLQLKMWKLQINYFLKLLGNCYSIGLMDKDFFHDWLVEFVSRIENFEFLPLAMHILDLFWDNICGVQSSNSQDVNNTQSLYILSKTAEMLLHKYYAISHSKSMINDDKYIINDIKKNNKIKEYVLSELRNFVCRLFKEQSLEVFLFPPASWDLCKPCLNEIISTIKDQKDEVHKKIELITYRNEALRSTSSLRESFTTRNISDIDGFGILPLEYFDINLAKRLNDNTIDFDWATFVEKEVTSLDQIFQLVLWAIVPNRKYTYESSQLVAKILLLTVSSVEGFKEYVVEDVIWSVVFRLSKLTTVNRNSVVSLPLLYRLLNMLILYGIIKVPTYIRKLISSGILYLPEARVKLFHCDVLINLKVSLLVKSQYNMVLKNVQDSDKTLYEKYNFDQLLKQVDDIKQIILQKDDEIGLLNCPYSVKIMVGEWFLSYVCNRELELVDKFLLLKNFSIFCVQLDMFHHYYKWLEFIVYHQLLADIETLETLMDILLRYGKLFSQFINDHILFTKTFIFLYTKTLKEKDSSAYAMTSLMPFWKFFLKNFSFALSFDDDLMTELSAVYEEEKSKSEKIVKDKNYAIQLYDAINSKNTRISETVWNFSEFFQTSMKVLLSPRSDSVSFAQARRTLFLLMASNSREYSKFVAIYLKRKDFTEDSLIKLISAKVLALDHVYNALGIEFTVQLLSHKSVAWNGVFYEFHVEQYVRNNYKVILSYCAGHLQDYYELLIGLLNEYGSNDKLATIATEIICNIMNDNVGTRQQIVEDILHCGAEGDLSEEDDNHTIGEGFPAHLFSMLNYSNIWVFQAVMKCEIEQIMRNGEDTVETLEDFLMQVMENTHYSCLCRELFQRIENTETLVLVMDILEHEFLSRCVPGHDEIPNVYFVAITEIVASLSLCLQKYSSNVVRMSSANFELLEKVIAQLAQYDTKLLRDITIRVDACLKIFMVHQTSIFEGIYRQLRKGDNSRRLAYDAIDNLFQLFDKTAFHVGSKLMLYEILNALRLHISYLSSTDGASKIPIPDQLTKLPPFQVSSFMEDTSKDDTRDITLGITKETATITGAGTENSRWVIYDTNRKVYLSQLQLEPFHAVPNFQADDSNASFNNSCLNLSLFNATFQRSNPE